MQRISSRERLKSYVSAVLALLMVIFGLLHLPRISHATIGGMFTIVWLGFAVLVIASHLRILAKDDPSPSENRLVTKVEQGGRIRQRATQN